MARSTIKPQRSRGYGAILFFTFLASLGSIGLLAWELQASYVWETEVKSPKPKAIDHKQQAPAPVPQPGPAPGPIGGD